jgi:hypothetical protein
VLINACPATEPGVGLLAVVDGSIWIDFYGDALQSAFVDLATAQKILERAYTAQPGQSVRQLFSDLVQKGEY